MKKIKQLINNVYRICIVNPLGGKIKGNIEETDAGTDIMGDSMLRRIVAGDPLQFEPDPHTQEELRQRVRKNGRLTAPARNSLLDAFLPLFSTRHIEIKMAAISLVLFVMVGLGPKNNPASDRKMHLFFLADTLGDSSSFHHPAARDTAFSVQFK
jgi:hypothetical protein